jgi:hypothetical protein
MSFWARAAVHSRNAASSAGKAAGEAGRGVGAGVERAGAHIKEHGFWKSAGDAARGTWGHVKDHPGRYAGLTAGTAVVGGLAFNAGGNHRQNELERRALASQGLHR